jgi:uncharacterized protein YggE
MVKNLDLRKHRAPLTILVLSAIILSAIIIRTLPNEKDSVKTPSLQFPTGIPSALGTVSAIEAEEQEFNIISVTGSGTASMQASEATVTLGVQTDSASASEAVRLNAELMTRVIEAIKALGITEDYMRTVSYNVYPVYSRENYDQVVGYRTVNMITVTVTELELIGEAIDAAATNGANKIQGVSFGLSSESREELKRQAYLAALTDAEEKAELIAERLDITITGVLRVSETVYQPYQPYRDYEFALEGEVGAPTPILEGKLSVSVTVYVMYSFA